MGTHERARRPSFTRPDASSRLAPVEREQLASAVRQLFSARFLNQVLAARNDSYRKRILRVEIVAIALLDFVLLGGQSFLALIDRLRAGKVGDLPAMDVSRAAFYKRLKAISHEVFLDILRGATSHLASSRRCVRQWVSDLAPFASGIYAIDDTTLDALARKTKSLQTHPKGSMKTLGGRLGCAVDLTTGAFAEVMFDSDSEANEKNHVRPIVERLSKRSLLVFDLGYFAFTLFDYLSEGSYFFISRLRKKTSFKVVQSLADGSGYRDQVIYLGKYRADRAAYPVRLVELLIDGKWYRYITNVLSPAELPAPALWALYGQRWTIETSFAAVKRSLGMAHLHPCHQNGMLSQIWATLAVYQVLQDLRLEISAAHGWSEDEVSWQNLMTRIGWYAETPAQHGELRSWLVGGGDKLFLRKRGTRQRKLDILPPSLLSACREAVEPDFDVLKPSTPRQSRPQPRKKQSKTIVAGLS